MNSGAAAMSEREEFEWTVDELIVATGMLYQECNATHSEILHGVRDMASEQRDAVLAMYDAQSSALASAIRERDGAYERAAKVCWSLSDALAGRDDMLSEQGMAQQCAAAVRSLSRSGEGG